MLSNNFCGYDEFQINPALPLVSLPTGLPGQGVQRAATLRPRAVLISVSGQARNGTHRPPAFFCSCQLIPPARQARRKECGPNPKGPLYQLFFGAIMLCSLWATPQASCWAITDDERAQVAQLSAEISAAGQLYAAGSFAESAAKIGQAQQELAALLKSKEPALHSLLKPIYLRLSRAHGLLHQKGAKLTALPSWDELTNLSPTPSTASSDTESISFTRDIGPWLISTCGRCHINQQRGQFSMASYAALMQGAQGLAVVFSGNSRGSRLVDVIESGDMPRGGGQVSPEQLAKLKKWIDAGAKFDGPNPIAPLTSFVSVQPTGLPASSTTAPLSVTSASGVESVSFAKTIAPILTANCQGCHLGSRQASGGLRMDTFTQFLRGGDSGAVIVPGKSAESLLVKKIRGEVGNRMPAGGRPPLTTEQIADISNWIDAGAGFDGPSPDMNIDSVVAQVWAAAADHQALFERRRQRSLERWSKVLPTDQPTIVENDELLVLGNVPPDQLNTILQDFSGATALAKKLFKAPADKPLLKGGLSVFVLRTRYDYSEFGRMTERRELPQEWLGHWHADPLDTYGVLAADATAADSKATDKRAEALALQIVGGAYVGSHAQVPSWFAEGVARNLVKTTYRRGDQRLSVWERNYPVALLKVDKAQTLLEGRLDEEAAGLVGMGLTGFLMERNNRRRFDQLMELLRDGQTFEAACTATFAPPEVMVKSWLGK